MHLSHAARSDEGDAYWSSRHLLISVKELPRYWRLYREGSEAMYEGSEKNISNAEGSSEPNIRAPGGSLGSRPQKYPSAKRARFRTDWPTLGVTAEYIFKHDF